MEIIGLYQLSISRKQLKSILRRTTQIFQETSQSVSHNHIHDNQIVDNNDASDKITSAGNVEK